jgi:DNA invertase Pin-like site-specific DNA recombinase
MFGDHRFAGENSPLFGKHPSEETRRKMSLAKEGMYNGENNPNFGKHHSSETRRKMSKAQSGENNPSFGKTGENSPNAKLTFLQAEEIRKIIKNRITQTDIAKKFGVSRATIYNIINNKSYK